MTITKHIETSALRHKLRSLSKDELIDELMGALVRVADLAAPKSRQNTQVGADASAEDVRASVIEECAKVLDDAAQDWRRIRDPGMANNAAAYARRIRSLTSPDPKQAMQDGGGL